MADLGYIDLRPNPLKGGGLSVSLVGAGNYATASLLPVLKTMDDVVLNGLVTASGRTARGVAEQFGFAFCTDDVGAVMGDGTDAVMVATRHNSHAQFVVRAMQAGKHVYVEKPLALSVDELRSIKQAFDANPGCTIMTGYNRRFASMTEKVRDFFAYVKAPLVVNIRVNAGTIPADHWIHDPVEGGGRMIGEGCHFIDLACAICGALPKTIYAVGTAKADKAPVNNDNLCIAMMLDDGSVANIVYTAEGSKAMPKEYVEVFGGGRSAVINDWKELVLFGGGAKATRHRSSSQDKGQKNMLLAWVNGLKKGKPCMAYETQMHVALATIMAVESLTIGMPMTVDPSILEVQSDKSVLLD